MGGTFDPAHLGHIKISKEAKKKFKLEKVYWAVTNKNPFKSKSKKSLNDRINYTKTYAGPTFCLHDKLSLGMPMRRLNIFFKTFS